MICTTSVASLRLLAAAAWAVGVAFVQSASGGELDLSGSIAFEPRVFFDDPLFAEQSGDTFSSSAFLQPELRYYWGDSRIAAVGFARWDADDEDRTHLDVRELNYFYSAADWDVLVGATRVFWGVAESRHLVDILNQTDQVEDVDAEDRLGQPMLNVNYLSDAGAFSLFFMPYFRERTFPDAQARLRGPLPVESDPIYASDLERWNPDFALRYAQIFGDFDVGLSFFRGTSREPRFQTELADRGPILRPVHDVINQVSLDAQATKGAWLFKLEALTRGGHPGGRFFASVAGLEYTLFDIAATGADVGLLAEYLYDGRDDTTPPTPFEDDVFVGGRLALNDPGGTSLLAGGIVDTGDGDTIMLIEGSRRLGQDWQIALEARLFLGFSAPDVLNGFQRDDFITLRIARFF